MSTKDFADALIGLICLAQKELPFHSAIGFQPKADKLVKKFLKEFPLPSAHSEDFLTPRDEFAKAAMQGEFSTLADPNCRGMGDWNELAARAYRCADAMLKAREVKA